MKNILLIFIIFYLNDVTVSQNLGTRVNTPFGKINTVSLLDDDRIFIGTVSEGLYYSPDDGLTWIQITFPQQKVGTVYKSSKGDLYVDADYIGLFSSVNETSGWMFIHFSNMVLGEIFENSAGNILTYVTSTNSYDIPDSDILGVYLSTNGGMSWSHTYSAFINYLDGSYRYIRCSAKHPNGTLFVGTSAGIYKSVDGRSWSYSNFYGSISSMTATSDGVLFCCYGSDDFFVSLDYGNSWIPDNTLPLYPSTIWYIFHDKKDGIYVETESPSHHYYLYKQESHSSNWNWKLLGEFTDENGITKGYRPKINSKGDIFYQSGYYLYKISRNITGVEKDNRNTLPSSFSLYQNYPNPFNPSTTISYSLPQNTFVTLKIYNNLGQEIETLVNEVKSAGNYSVQFDGSSVSSGIYFYRLQTENFSQTRKLILLK